MPAVVWSLCSITIQVRWQERTWLQMVGMCLFRAVNICGADVGLTITRVMSTQGKGRHLQWRVMVSRHSRSSDINAAGPPRVTCISMVLLPSYGTENLCVQGVCVFTEQKIKLSDPWAKKYTQSPFPQTVGFCSPVPSKQMSTRQKGTPMNSFRIVWPEIHNRSGLPACSRQNFLASVIIQSKNSQLSIYIYGLSLETIQKSSVFQIDWPQIGWSGLLTVYLNMSVVLLLRLYFIDCLLPFTPCKVQKSLWTVCMSTMPAALHVDLMNINYWPLFYWLFLCVCNLCTKWW